MTNPNLPNSAGRTNQDIAFGNNLAEDTTKIYADRL